MKVLIGYSTCCLTAEAFERKWRDRMIQSLVDMGNDGDSQ